MNNKEPFVSFVRSSELFWNAMEKQFVSRTHTTPTMIKENSNSR